MERGAAHDDDHQGAHHHSLQRQQRPDGDQRHGTVDHALQGGGVVHRAAVLHLLGHLHARAAAAHTAGQRGERAARVNAACCRSSAQCSLLCSLLPSTAAMRTAATPPARACLEAYAVKHHHAVVDGVGEGSEQGRDGGQVDLPLAHGEAHDGEDGGGGHGEEARGGEAGAEAQQQEGAGDGGGDAHGDDRLLGLVLGQLVVDGVLVVHNGPAQHILQTGCV